MDYKVIVAFADLRDANHVYNVGDIYPREGYKASIERCEELASSENLQGKPLIKAASSRGRKKKAGDSDVTEG